MQVKRVERTTKKEYSVGERDVLLHVRFIPKDTARKALKKSTKTKYKHGVPEQDTDFDKYAVKVVDEALVDIEGLQYQDLKYIFEADVEVTLPAGKTWSDSVDYNEPRNKKVILSCMTNDFALFVVGCARETTGFIEDEEGENENLGNGSDSKEVKKGKVTPN